ncbi:hypothetical protein ACOAKC_04160 [Hathewaya histolytica]|uniref:hypothetical protein n=1 Tax=Hathewaya histolytica TaxID=1498 RepID=UPI003B67742A
MDWRYIENTKLKEFNFGSKKIIDNDIAVYTKMPNLEILQFPPNFYTTEQIAWLVAKLPNVRGYALRPYIYFERKNGDEFASTLICGKRKPFIYHVDDKQQRRIQRYVLKFNDLVDKYRNDITIIPPT